MSIRPSLTPTRRLALRWILNNVGNAGPGGLAVRFPGMRVAPSATPLEWLVSQGFAVSQVHVGPRGGRHPAYRLTEAGLRLLAPRP